MNLFRLLSQSVAVLALFGAMSDCARAPASAGTGSSGYSTAPEILRPSAIQGSLPELPRVYLSTSYTTPSGRTINVPAEGDLQAAINSAQPGDIILLQPGATYSGNFTLPNKSGTGWIVIRSAAPDASIPPEGTRATPSHASMMPKIITPNSEPVIQTAAGAHHYRFIGIEFTVAAGVTSVFNLIGFDADQSEISDTPHDLIIDRCYVHGTPTGNLKRGLALNSASTAVIDSWFSDFHHDEADAQAIAGWNGPGPFKIVNNYLEGAAENFLLGGADPDIQGLIPSDIEFRRNHVFKPFSWKVGHPSYAGRRWVVKNLFELKNAQRVLVDSNIFENNWGDAQDGMAILFTPRNQDGNSPWSVVQDVTFTNNIVRHSGGGFNISGPDNEAGVSEPARRILIRNNLIEDIDGVKYGSPTSGPSDGEFLQIVGGPQQIMVEHNTVMQAGNIVTVDGARSYGFVFRDNLAPNNTYGVIGSEGVGSAAISHYFPDAVFVRNVIAGGPDITYPPDNFRVPTLDDITFIDRAHGNYRLSPGSPYRAAGSDGRDVGCDFDALGLRVTEPAVVAAASYRGGEMASESIVSAFGTALSESTTSASTVPLPHSLDGVTVWIRDNDGVEQLCPLYFISPGQINFGIPGGVAEGPAIVTLTSGRAAVASTTIRISTVAPGVFAADASGSGVAAAEVVRTHPDHTQTYEPVARFDPEEARWMAVPIDLGPAFDTVTLVIYGTGIRHRSALAAVTATVGEQAMSIGYAGSQLQYPGLDQVNLDLARELAGAGDVDLRLIVDGRAANTVRITIK